MLTHFAVDHNHSRVVTAASSRVLNLMNFEEAASGILSLDTEQAVCDPRFREFDMLDDMNFF